MLRFYAVFLTLVICATVGVVFSGGAIADGPETNVSVSGQAAPGEEIVIEFRLENTDDTPRGYVLNASVPDSWVVVNQSSDGAFWNEEDQKWAWMTVQPDSVVTASMTVAVPENATDSYTLEALAKDAEGQRSMSSSTVVINTLPITRDETYTTEEGSVLKVPAPGVLDNDADPDGELLSAEVVRTPDNGRLQFQADGSFVYVPDPGFSGQDSFVYEAVDEDDGTRNATVSITVHSATETSGPPDSNDGTEDNGLPTLALVVGAAGLLVLALRVW
ncbi:cadherin-like domain-containing protein [Halapricum salinum]|uniref:Cadherin-like domain-containing protein n=1 Tax=Halapricum salinum TaxID=1457250 RepID=A0A4D6H866_9EURY|nr:cadherin-like domain-containing protein [Halapricum salinum]QCC50033.1 hypothetical protein DV733_01815 [Halapricum salinum]